MPTTEIWREITFEAAHRLPHVPEGHKCARLHGHSYRVRVYVRGAVDPHLGWFMDLGELRDRLEPIRLRLARWIWERVAPSLPGLCRIEVMETCTSGCRYEGA
jgi:6-pyruvoyltetrahydropterin/6-carboxytetrahydropterin synthase